MSTSLSSHFRNLPTFLRTLLFMVLLVMGVSAQAATITGAIGGSVTFTVSAQGTPPFTYQWYKGASAISGATASTYTISNVKSTDAGDYLVQVVNSVGTATSETTTLVVVAPVTITTQPASSTVAVGSAANFSVVASGTPTLTYQWYKNYGVITGATSSTYSIPATTAADAGTYTVAVSNAGGTVSSWAATLAVLTPPSITTKPVSTTVVPGKPATFTVVAAGSPTLTYQWNKAGSPISGATSSTFTIPSATSADAGAYTVTVSNAVGSVTSASATLYLVVSPSITTQPANVTLVGGKSASFWVVTTGTPTLTFQWYKNGTAITGATSSMYTIAATTAADAGNYTVIVTNAAASVSSNQAVLTVITVPTITAQPIGLTITTGKPATFSVSAAGSPTFTYQWLKNGSAIPGATGSSYTIAATSSADAGSYSVNVTNAAGTTASSSASLVIKAAPTETRLTALSLVETISSTNTSISYAFTIEGPATCRYLFRGAGPALSKFGLTGYLAQPKIELHQTVSGVDTTLISNQGWGSVTGAAGAFVEAGAYAFDAGSADAAFVYVLAPGTYTIILSSANGGYGKTFLEMYVLP